LTAGLATGGVPVQDAVAAEPAKAPLKLGLMTYSIAKDWNLETCIKNCLECKLEHIEFRTTHAHGVEVSLSKAERRDVKQRLADAGLTCSLASAFAYHWSEPERVRADIEGTKEYTLLAADIGARGIRVFPNAILESEGIPVEQTVAQIGKAVSEAGTFAGDHGVHIRLANHGKGTDDLLITKRILDHTTTPHVYVNWNCDETDVLDPGFDARFDLVKDRISNIHLHDLHNTAYPYRRLFERLREIGYQGYCDAEIGPSEDAIAVLKYYRALFLALQNAY
jgi:sugar phosphate isomerase/epimerase